MPRLDDEGHITPDTLTADTAAALASVEADPQDCRVYTSVYTAISGLANIPQFTQIATEQLERIDDLHHHAVDVGFHTSTCLMHLRPAATD